jgi:hypothetical protein
LIFAQKFEILNGLAASGGKFYLVDYDNSYVITKERPYCDNGDKNIEKSRFQEIVYFFLFFGLVSYL